MQSLVRRGAVLAGAIALAAVPAGAASAAHVDPLERYQERMTVDRIVNHMERFQRYADANGGTRASGTPGYLWSVRYVVGQLRAAKYRPTVQRFDFPFYQQVAPSVLERVGSDPATFVEGTDYETMEYSGRGDATGQVQAVDLVLPPGAAANTSTSGCEPADFAGFVAGRIALMQRGSCTFGLKVANAAAAGAVGAIIFNEGQADLGRADLFVGTLGGPADIPVFSASFAFGEQLANQAATGLTLRMQSNTFSEVRPTYNVIADSTLGRPDKDNTIVVGAHLDSVVEGPGINDNGSGSGMILELARQLHRSGIAAKNRVRFMWYGAEESGLLGSEFYVANLRERHLRQIKMMLNFDMVASPNGVLGVYDGDGSSTPAPGPEGSAAIEAAFLQAFDELGRITTPTEFSGRSDYGPFIAEGIPAGGLFTGAEVLKTQEQADVYGGVAGEQLDPCYHEACDTLEHVRTFADGLGLDLLDANSDAAAAVLYRFSQADTLPGAAAPRAGARTAATYAQTSTAIPYKGRHLDR